MSQMDVTDLWTDILRWLRRNAPITAAALRPPSRPDFSAVEADFEVSLPEELRAWWESCGGTEPGVLADVLPPSFTPYSCDTALESWREHRKTWAAQWQRPACGLQAGSAGSSYHPAWLPIAGDGFSDELVVDLREGPWRGCVLEWEQETATASRPEWPGLVAMLQDVNRALRDGVSAGHCHPAVTRDGRLDWQIR